MGEEIQLERLRRRRDALNVQITAVENGLLPWLEAQGPKWVLVADVTAEFDLSAQAANNQMLRLVRHGFAERKRRNGPGKVFVYRGAEWTDKLRRMQPEPDGGRTYA